MNRTDFSNDSDLEAVGVVQHSAYPEAVWESHERGHLAPDQLMDWSCPSRGASYPAANIAAQGAKFNRGRGVSWSR
jgi:DNA/RNA endonuclease G (NUC1)